MIHSFRAPGFAMSPKQQLRPGRTAEPAEDRAKPESSSARHGGRGNQAAQERLRARSEGDGPRLREALATPAVGIPFRSELEANFGMPLGRCRAHLGTPAVQAALDDLGAEALAVGDDLLFASATPDKQLVAHEVAHLRQQAAPSGASAPGDAAELNADAAAKAALEGREIPAPARATGRLQGSWLSSLTSAISGAASSAASGVARAVSAVASGITGGTPAVQPAVSPVPAASPAPSPAERTTRDPAASPTSAQGAPGTQRAQQAPVGPQVPVGSPIGTDAGALGTGVSQSTAGTISGAISGLLGRASKLASDFQQKAESALTVLGAAAGVAKVYLRGRVEAAKAEMVETYESTKETAASWWESGKSFLSEVKQSAVDAGTAFAGWVSRTAHDAKSAIDKLGLNPVKNYTELARPASTQYGAEYAQAEGSPKIIFQPGMMTDAEQTEISAEALADLLQLPVTAIANPTLGFGSDLAECAREKYLGISGTPTKNLKNEILKSITATPPEKVLVYAHSQGSINAAGAVRELEQELIKQAKADGLQGAEAKSWAREQINAYVEIQPVGGAANLDDGSLDDIGSPDPSAGVLQQTLDFATDIPGLPLRVTEAMFGDYPGWFKGVDDPIVDANDAIPTQLTDQGEDYRLETEDAKFIPGTGTHGFEQYTENYGDELKEPLEAS